MSTAKRRIPSVQHQGPKIVSTAKFKSDLVWVNCGPDLSVRYQGAPVDSTIESHTLTHAFVHRVKLSYTQPWTVTHPNTYHGIYPSPLTLSQSIRLHVNILALRKEANALAKKFTRMFQVCLDVDLSKKVLSACAKSCSNPLACLVLAVGRGSL